MISHKPLSPDKGKEGGSCNRRACQEPNSAFCYNSIMYAWYCRQCANDINAVAKSDGMTPFIDVPSNYNELRRNARQSS